jgi:hypothetical protein
MTVFRSRHPRPTDRVRINPAVFFPTRPTPRFATARTYMELSMQVQAARKHIGARVILQTPASTPGTGLRIFRTGLLHFILPRDNNADKIAPSSPYR